MKFFIVTPTYSGKAYCDEEWAASVNSQAGNDVSFRHIVVDSSPGAAYATRLRTLLPDATVVRRAGLAGQEIDPLLLAVHVEARTAFLTGVGSDCDAYLSWESDVIAPANALFVMQQILNYGVDVMLFGYPEHENNNNMMAGLGFTGIKRAVLASHAWDNRGGYGQVDDMDNRVVHSIEGWLFRRAARAGLAIGTLNNLVILEHRNG